MWRCVSALAAAAICASAASAQLTFSNVPAPATHANTTAILVPATGTSGNAAPYPSNILLGNAAGPPLSVRLLDFSHTFLADVDFALVGPNSRALVLFGDQGGGAPAIHANVTFNDAGAPYAGGPLAGDVTLHPLGGDGSTFGGVLPGGLTFVNSFAELAGGDPNGTWQFYAFDEATGDKGQVAGGWELTAPTRTVALPATGTSGNANPYPSNVVVSGAVGAPLSVRFLDFSHTFLSDLDFALVAPNDRALMLLSNQGGGAPAIHANVTFNDAGAPYAGGPLAGDVTIRPLGGSGAGFGGTLPGGLTFVNSLAELGVGNPNGTWRLFAVDVATGDRGQLADGWQLTFAVLPEPASIALLATGLAGLAIAGVRRRRPSA